MIHKELYIGKWHIEFFFALDGYDDELILETLYDMEASYAKMREANRIMDSKKKNAGYAYTNAYIKRGMVFIGPVTSSAEFLNTLVHEIHHVAVAIADDLNVDLDGETPAYIAGDSARDLAETICLFGCPDCEKHK